MLDKYYEGLIKYDLPISIVLVACDEFHFASLSKNQSDWRADTHTHIILSYIVNAS